MSVIVSLLSVLAFADSAFYEKTFSGGSLFDYAGIESPYVDGYAAYVYNLETGSVMYQKNQNDLVYPASTVKLMTAIVAYENSPDLQKTVTASQDAVKATSGSNMSIKAGETFTVEQLLYGLLVTGANDAANVLAENIGGSIQGFCDMMNEKAKEIGASDTHFTNPTGLHSDDMKTTAKDIAIIGRYFYYINDLFEMSNTTRYTVPETEYTRQQRILLNRNFLISRARSDDYYYPRARGLSLGGTPEAGECIVTSAYDDSGLNYLCVVMNAHTIDDVNMACVDAANLLKTCIENFSYSTVLSEKNVICEIPVRLAADTDYVTLLPKSDLKAILPNELDYASEITVEPRVSKDYASAPVYEGDVFGEAVVKYKGDVALGSVSLAAGKSIDKSNVLYFLDRAESVILGRWFKVFATTAIILLALYFAASVFFTSKRRKRRYRR